MSRLRRYLERFARDRRSDRLDHYIQWHFLAFPPMVLAAACATIMFRQIKGGTRSESATLEVTYVRLACCGGADRAGLGKGPQTRGGAGEANRGGGEAQAGVSAGYRASSR